MTPHAAPANTPVMRLGTCYYPEQWPEDWWADDATHMADMGLSRVRIGEFAWSRIEPEPGRFDWGWLDRAVAVLHAAGLGIIMLARESGRPILPVAIATSRFKRLNNWDRSVIHLPFGRGVIVGSETINVPRDADAATMEALRVKLETNLNALTRRAYAIVGRPDEGTHA